MTFLRQRLCAARARADHAMGFYPKSCHQMLIEAVIAGRVSDSLEALAAGGNPNRPDALGDTPLLWAAAMGHEALVDILVEHGASLSLTNAAGDTLLHAAARQGHAGLLMCWVQPDTALETPNRQGQTVWELALRNSKPVCAQALAARHAADTWIGRPKLAAQRLRQAMGWSSDHLKAVLDAGGAIGWDTRPDAGSTPWEEILTRWSDTAARWRPEGAPVLAFRRRRSP